MTDAAGRAATRRARRRWLWDHIGRLTGVLFGLLLFAGVVFLAAIGDTPAFGLVAIVVVGVVLIAVGGRIQRR